MEFSTLFHLVSPLALVAFLSPKPNRISPRFVICCAAPAPGRILRRGILLIFSPRAPECPRPPAAPKALLRIFARAKKWGDVCPADGQIFFSQPFFLRCVFVLIKYRLQSFFCRDLVQVRLGLRRRILSLIYHNVHYFFWTKDCSVK